MKGLDWKHNPASDIPVVAEGAMGIWDIVNVSGDRPHQLSYAPGGNGAKRYVVDYHRNLSEAKQEAFEHELRHAKQSAYIGLLTACEQALGALQVLSPACHEGQLGERLRKAIETARPLI